MAGCHTDAESRSARCSGCIESPGGSWFIAQQSSEFAPARPIARPKQGSTRLHIGLHIGLHLGILGIHGFFGIFGDFSGIFWIFCQILGFLAPGRSESCRRLRDLQKSIVILSNGAVWTRNVSLLIKILNDSASFLPEKLKNHVILTQNPNI